MKPCESYSDDELSSIMDEIEKMSDGALMYNGEAIETSSLESLQHTLEIVAAELKRKKTDSFIKSW